MNTLNSAFQTPLAISKLNLQIYAFFYIEIMKFPPTFFESEAFTTNELFEFVHKLM